MTTKTPPRERLLETAETLFYREGIRAVGVDRLCDEAGVSKRSMYQHFGSKDDVVVAVLDARAEALAQRLMPAGDLTPRERILALFDAAVEMQGAPGYQGCPFVSAATELKDREHPASVSARTHKLEMTRFLEDQARLAGAADPALLAVQLTLVFDGASAYGVVRGGATDATLATVETLLAAAGV